MKRRISFQNWCKKDIDDTRRINYTVNYENKIYKFTSDKTFEEAGLPFGMWWLAEHAMVDSVELRNNEWYIVLSGRK